jgi:hypothetical protein
MPTPLLAEALMVAGEPTVAWLAGEVTLTETPLVAGAEPPLPTVNPKF